MPIGSKIASIQKSTVSQQSSQSRDASLTSHKTSSQHGKVLVTNKSKPNFIAAHAKPAPSQMVYVAGQKAASQFQLKQGGKAIGTKPFSVQKGQSRNSGLAVTSTTTAGPSGLKG